MQQWLTEAGGESKIEPEQEMEMPGKQTLPRTNGINDQSGLIRVHLR
jgi:hypothetical protein